MRDALKPIQCGERLTSNTTPRDPVQRWLFLAFVAFFILSCVRPPYLQFLLLQHVPTLPAAFNTTFASGPYADYRTYLGTDRDLWKPFASIQQVRAAPPGFVWHARNFVLPGIAVQVHDAYVDHEGLLHAALLGLWTVAQVRGGGDFARDELMRWLAEAAWVPTALLPSQGVRWEAIDEHRARATLRDGAIEATLDFEFGADDLIAAVRAPARGRMVDGRRIPTTWEGRWSRYEQRGGMWIPITGEVAWLLPEGRKAYWRGTLTAADYDSVPAAR